MLFSYGIKIWTDLYSVLSQSTLLADGRTDRILIARPRVHSMRRCKYWSKCGCFWRYCTL